jgi:hypothetical protein
MGTVTNNEQVVNNFVKFYTIAALLSFLNMVSDILVGQATILDVLLSSGVIAFCIHNIDTTRQAREPEERS